MLDDRHTFEHAEVVTNERLDEIRVVAGMRGVDGPHAARVSGG